MRAEQLPKRLMIVGGILLLLYTFTVSHVDCNTITTWAYDLLGSIGNGSLREYPIFTYEAHNMATNYTLFSNVVNAIWLLPVYLIDSLFHIGLSMTFYDVWYKVLILLACLLTLFLTERLLGNLGYSTYKKCICLFTLATSSILLISVIGKGQIDIFDMLFVILSMHLYLDERIELSFLCLGVGCLFKPFLLLLGLPYFFLMVRRCRYRSFINAICMTLPYILNLIITSLIMPEYFEMSEITSEEFKKLYKMTRLEEFFHIRFNYIYVFLALAIIICAICLYISLEGKTDNFRLIFYPTIMFMAFAIFVVPDALYWFIVVMPLFVIMGINLRRITDFLTLNFLINLSVSLLVLFLDKTFIPGKSFSAIGVLSHNMDIYSYIEDIEILGYARGVLTTLFIVCMLLLCTLYFYEKKNGDKLTPYNDEGTSIVKANTAPVYIQVIPALCYLVFSYIVS